MILMSERAFGTLGAGGQWPHRLFYSSIIPAKMNVNDVFKRTFVPLVDHNFLDRNFFDFFRIDVHQYFVNHRKSSK